jgi:S-formylglutathione hydrolase FrmB
MRDSDQQRSRSRSRLWLWLSASAVGAVAALLAFVGAATASAQLVLLSTQHVNPRLWQLSFRTQYLAGPTGVRILLPSGYSTSHRRYPVLYLLHGSFDSYQGWTTEGNAEQATAKLPLIVVMPDAGIVGNYTNWYNNGSFGLPEWESYHIDQLLPWIDAHYRTIDSREGRAVAGLSMGGGGAIKYAAVYPDKFVAAASFSGAVDSNNSVVWQVTQASGVSDGDHQPGAIFGLHATDDVRWRDNNPWDLAENLRGLKLWLFTGNGQPGGPDGNNFDLVEQNVYQESLSLHQRLDALGIPHVWDEYGAGAHQWYYWDRDLVQFLPGLMSVFGHPPPPPSPFSYTRADPTYSVYGWTVHISRPAMEFSELADAGPDGFTLRGSGIGTVTTAAIFRPDAKVRATLSSGRGIRSTKLRANPAGQVTVTVPLGPGNPYQQYTTQAETWALTENLSDTPGSDNQAVGGSFVYSTQVALSGR